MRPANSIAVLVRANLTGKLTGNLTGSWMPKRNSSSVASSVASLPLLRTKTASSSTRHSAFPATSSTSRHFAISASAAATSLTRPSAFPATSSTSHHFAISAAETSSTRQSAFSAISSTSRHFAISAAATSSTRHSAFPATSSTSRRLTTSAAEESSTTTPGDDDATSMHDKVYELRIYDFKPDFLADFMKLSNENFHLRTKHSKLLGYWFTEFGGANQVVHIWEYDSFAHRKLVRAALAEDPDWIGVYVSKLVKYLDKQDNTALTLLPWSEVEQPAHSGGIYELCAHTMNGSESKWNLKMRDMLMGKEESHQGTLLGAWKAQAGGVMNTVYHLWHYPDLDNRIRSSNEAAQNPDYVLTKEELLPFCSQYWTKILNPAPWSPMK